MNEAVARRFTPTEQSWIARVELKSTASRGLFDRRTPLRRERLLSAIEFTYQSSRAPTALALLDGDCAYAEPCPRAPALSWGQPSPLAAPEERSSRWPSRHAGGPTSPSAWPRSRPRSSRKTSLRLLHHGRDLGDAPRRSLPLRSSSGASTHRRARERDDIRIFRLSRIRGVASQASPSTRFRRPRLRSSPVLQRPTGSLRAGLHRAGMGPRAGSTAGRASLRARRNVRAVAGADDAPDEDGIVFETVRGCAAALSWVLAWGIELASSGRSSWSRT